jgi:hypothetical protein
VVLGIVYAATWGFGVAKYICNCELLNTLRLARISESQTSCNLPVQKLPVSLSFATVTFLSTSRSYAFASVTAFSTTRITCSCSFSWTSLSKTAMYIPRLYCSATSIVAELNGGTNPILTAVRFRICFCSDNRQVFSVPWYLATGRLQSSPELMPILPAPSLLAPCRSFHNKISHSLHAIV